MDVTRDVNQERVMRLTVAMLEALGGTFEAPKELIEDQHSYAGCVIYVDFDDNGNNLRYTLKKHGVVTGELDTSEDSGLE